MDSVSDSCEEATCLYDETFKNEKTCAVKTRSHNVEISRLSSMADIVIEKNFHWLLDYYFIRLLGLSVWDG